MANSAEQEIRQLFDQWFDEAAAMDTDAVIGAQPRGRGPTTDAGRGEGLMAKTTTLTNAPPGTRQADSEALVRALVEEWAQAIRNEDIDGVLAHHADDIVLFDVPPPLQAKGLEAYRAAWELFFSLQGKGAFDLGDLDVVAGDSVAFCRSIVTCGSSDPKGQFQVRLTVGLRKVNGDWLVTHELHSVPAE